MASYTKTIQAHKSENSGTLEVMESFGVRFAISTKSNTLYVAKQRRNSQQYVYNNYPTIWFDLTNIPLGKTITSATLYFYVRRSYSEYVRVWDDIRINSGWNSQVVENSSGIYRGNISYVTIKQIDTTVLNYSDYGDWGEIDSHLASNKPYIVVTYEDTPPNKPSQQFPSNVNLDARTPIKFSWRYSSQDNQVQNRYEIQYSIDEQSTWTTVSGNNANEYHNFVANTFPETGTIYWKIRVRDSNNLWSDWSNVYKFNTVVTPQKTPRIISPTSGYLDGSEKIKLSWEFLGGADYDTQGKYELQYSTDGSSWNTISRTTPLQEHEFEKDFFGSGRVEWKVKTFNTFNDESDFTEIVAFNVISSPPIPQIQSITNSSRPKISWISVEQQYYEIRIYDNSNILIYEIKEPSINKLHDVKIFLDDGNYKAELVIFNQYNLNSETVTMNFTITTVKPPQPIIDVYSGEYSNTIRGNSNTQITRVYRDNIFIGLLENNIFQDFTCENRREYQYHLRSIDEEGNFSDSDTKIGICHFRSNTISLAKLPGNFIKLKYGFNAIPSKNTRKSVIGSNFHFDGREYQVTEFSEFKSTEKSLKFFTRDKSDIDKLEELIDKKEVLLYRDVEGENIYGTVLSIDHDKEMLGYNFGFTINKTDYSGDLDD